MSAFKDLTGMKFNKLTVLHRAENKNKKIHWLCKCDCGNTAVVDGGALKSGGVKSCGCANHQASIKRIKDLTGKRFGKLLVLSMCDYRIDGLVSFNCICDCGNKVVVKSVALTSRHTKSCGCLKSSKPGGRFRDLVGKRFGKLLVIEMLTTTASGDMRWKCRCDCGNEHITTSNLLMTGHTKSCGCLVRPSLLGEKFGRLTVLENLGPNDKNNISWLCKCSCGNTITVITSLLTNGGVRSCGCLSKELLIDRTKKRAKELRSYPQWFLDELYFEDDKIRAVSNKLMTLEQVWFKCEKHGKYLQRVADHITLSTGNRRSSCPKCSGNIAFTGSKQENEIKGYIAQLIPNEEILKARILEVGDTKQEIDIYIPSMKLGIEFNGSAFHASENSSFNAKDKKYHQEKFLQAEKQGIHLMTIFDVDWVKNEDKIKQYIHDLVVPCKKIFARKCELEAVDKKTAVEFENKYHLQGSNPRLAEINYGLYLDSELLAVMSFGKLRLSKTEEGQYELHRYCVKAGYNIVGGANRLLKAFERENSPKYILSYSDNDYFIGAIYPRLGFNFIHNSTPRYYWYLRGEEIKREKCQLKYLKEDYPDLFQEAIDNEAPNKEIYVMSDLGAMQVYRSGTKKWEKVYE